MSDSEPLIPGVIITIPTDLLSSVFFHMQVAEVLSKGLWICRFIHMYINIFKIRT